jgi:hypothetical protein
MPRLWLVVLLGACAREADRPAGDKAPAPMKKEERQRGIDLCEGYVARVCACAAREVSLKDTCELARAQPEALQLPLALLDGAKGELNENERRLSESAARKIIAACVKADGALSLERCPRP